MPELIWREVGWVVTLIQHHPGTQRGKLRDNGHHPEGIDLQVYKKFILYLVTFPCVVNKVYKDYFSLITMNILVNVEVWTVAEPVDTLVDSTNTAFSSSKFHLASWQSWATLSWPWHSHDPMGHSSSPPTQGHSEIGRKREEIIDTLLTDNCLGIGVFSRGTMAHPGRYSMY